MTVFYFNLHIKVKMKIITYLSFLSLLFVLTSCSAILGIKEPEGISKQKAIEYLYSHKLDTCDIIYLKCNYLDTLQQLAFKPGWEVGFRPIQFKIFNKFGDLIFQYSSCEGPLKNTSIFDIFPPKNISPIDTSYTIENEQLLTVEKLTIKEHTDYVAVIYWATYTGIIGRKFLKKINKILENQDVTIQIYKFNTDYIIEE